MSGVPDDDTIRFLVGTQSIKFENQVKKEFFFFFCKSRFQFEVHFLEFDEESGSLGKSIYAHRAGEIWRMASSPNDYRRFATIYQNSNLIYLKEKLVLFCVSSRFECC